MTFPANELEVALLQAFEQQVTVEVFVARLLDDVVWVPLAEQPDGSQAMPTVTMDEHELLPVFTSEEQLRAGAADSPRVRPPVRDLLATLPGHIGLAVNVGAEVGLPIDAATLRQLHERTVLPVGTTIRIGEPAHEPVDVLHHLGSALALVTTVREARRCWAQIGEEPPGLIVGLALHPDEPRERQRALETVREVAVISRRSIDIVFFSEHNQFTEWMSTNATPFYVA